MFNKNDPLIGSVKQVMAENQIRRDVEKQLNEEFGITTKKGLPFEYHAEYDALLEQRIAEAKEGSIPNTPKEKSLARLHGDPNRITHGDVLKGRGVVEEEGEETREGGAVTRNGKPVVSPTAHKAEPEGPSKSDRDALTAKIKGIMKEEQLDETSKKKAWIHAMAAKDNIADIRSKYGKRDTDWTDNDLSDKDKNTIRKRTAGLIRTAKKLTSEEAAQLEEKKLTDAEMAKREEIVKSMKKGAKGFKSRYGKRAEEVMYATATKQAKNLAEEDFDLDAVMEEIRANLGEEAFAALMNEAPAPLPPRRPQTGPAGTASQPQASNPRGDTVTGIEKNKGEDYNIYKKGSKSASEFQQLYAAARKPGPDGQRFGTVSWQGRSYSTGLKGGKGEYVKPADKAAAEGQPGSAAQRVLNAPSTDPDTRAQMNQTTSGAPDITASPATNRLANAGGYNNENPKDREYADITTRERTAAGFGAGTLGGAMRGTMPPEGKRTGAQQVVARRQEAGTLPKGPEPAPQQSTPPMPPPRPRDIGTQPQAQPKKREPDTSSTMGGFMPEQKTGTYMRESLETTIKKVLKG